jgi:glycosyltransferase involved in cell wall biosynthesis
MKITQIVCTFPPYKGGMGNVAEQFSKGLARRGHEVAVFTPDYKKAKLPIRGLAPKNEFNFKVERIKPLFKIGNAAALSKIEERIKDFDLIHLHYPFFGTAYFIYKFKKQFPEKKLIATYHMDAIGDGLKGLFFKLYSKILMPRILNSADAITVSSIDYIKNSQVKNFYRNNQNKFIELPFGVDVEKFKPREKDKELMSKIGIQPNNKVVLFVGGLDKAHYFKGLELLIRAVKQLEGDGGPTSNLEVGPPLKLLIIGEGDLKTYYQNLVKKLNLENIIKFIGVGGYNDLPKYYNLCDLLVLSSINSAEAFGLVLIEAMACGKAVVASDLPGVRTVPVNKKHCIVKVNNIEDLTNKIFNLLTNDELRAKIGKAGRKKVEEEYNWDKKITQLEKIYLEL